MSTKPVRESTVENYFIARVKANGGEVRKVKWINHRGAPDRFVMMPGVSCFVELKRPGEEPEAHQAREHDRLVNAGNNVAVIDTKEKVDMFMDDLKQLQNERH